MEDRDDGIGSEINTPRDVQYTVESQRNLAQVKFSGAFKVY